MATPRIFLQLRVHWESLANYKAPEWYEDAKFGEGDELTGIRFTRNKEGTVLYAVLLEWVDGTVRIESVNDKTMGRQQVAQISILGSGHPLKWEMNQDGLHIQMPREKPSYDHAYPIKIELHKPMKQNQPR
jgi:hypothetical protein